MYSKTQKALRLLSSGWKLRTPRALIWMTSPGSTSRRKRGAQVVEGAALGGDDPAAVQPPEAERAHAERVAHGEEGVGREDDEAVGALDASHHVGEALRPGVAGRVGEDAGHDLGVGGRA